MRNTFLTILFIFSGLLSASATEKDSVRIFFRQSHTELDENFNENATSLYKISHRLASIGADATLTKVKVIGAASPEGSVTFNRYLSEKRATRIFDYFSKWVETPDTIMSFEFIGRDWKGLRDLAAKDNNLPLREETIALIDEICKQIESGRGDTEENLGKLKRLGGGEPYAYMYSRLFPILRSSRLYVEYFEPEIRIIPFDASPELEVTVSVPSVNLVFAGFYGKAESKCRPFYMSLKSNLLYDAAMLPTIGAEFYVGKGWSINADWTYGWWDRDRSHWYWRAYGGDLGVRKWFGRKAAEKPLTGHHLGIYAGTVTYDFEFGGEGKMGGIPHKTLWDRCNFYAGLEYGYSLPIGRRLNLDFSLGVGYLGGKVIDYVPEGNCYRWRDTRRFTWIGPTKAEISLVWLIGCDNYNRKKGGN